jgi:hypothetical protein
MLIVYVEGGGGGGGGKWGEGLGVAYTGPHSEIVEAVRVNLAT